jgi:hypothetical protein
MSKEFRVFTTSMKTVFMLKDRVMAMFEEKMASRIEVICIENARKLEQGLPQIDVPAVTDVKVDIDFGFTQDAAYIQGVRIVANGLTITLTKGEIEAYVDSIENEIIYEAMKAASTNGWHDKNNRAEMSEQCVAMFEDVFGTN